MKTSVLVLAMAGLGLGGCAYLPGTAVPAEVDPARQAQLVSLVEGSGCVLDQQENDALLDPAGFSDAEASAISRQLLAEGRAELTSEGDLALRTENCL